ncbi:unnamed protein product, partial [Prorocentrum cordatum]
EVWSGTMQNGDKVRVVFSNKQGDRWLQVLQKRGQLFQMRSYLNEEDAVAFLVPMVKKYVNGEIDKPEMEMLKTQWLKDGNGKKKS